MRLGIQYHWQQLLLRDIRHFQSGVHGMTKGLLGGRYELVGMLGSGGMQHVHRAKDHLRGVDVALKTPQAGQVVKKFSNSAILSARVNHPHVAKTLDYLEESGVPYLAEELVEGGTLEDACMSVAGLSLIHI